ncbi:MAG: AhpC/TSA family protein [Bacteroidales bacterium]|nr:AhpC/TSA family protein [Bacteroidales bacterium]
MKRTIFFLLATLTLVAGAGSACAQQATMKGTFKGIADKNVRLVVQRHDGDKVAVVDTVKFDKHGSFKLTLPTFNPTLYSLTLTQKNSPTLFALLSAKEKTSIEATYDPGINYLHLDRTQGSDNLEVFALFNRAVGSFIGKVQPLEREFRADSTTDNRRKEIQQEYQQLFVRQQHTVRQIVAEHQSTLVSAFISTFFLQDFPAYADLLTDVRDALMPRYADDFFVHVIDSLVTESLAPGRLVADIALPSPNGDTLRLSSLKGRIIMIDFWASWCRPCRMENPNVVRVYDKYHDKGFEIFSVSLDNNKQAWVNAIAQDGLKWPNHVSDLAGWGSSAAALYGVRSIPHTILVDRHGRVIARNLRAETLEQKLEELFGQ